MNDNFSEITPPVSGETKTSKSLKIPFKIFVLVLVFSIMITAVVSVMTTSFYLNREYSEQVNTFISTFTGNTYYTLDEVQRLFGAYYLGDVEDLTEDEITDAIIKMYIAKTGDKYAQYWNEEEYDEYLSEMEGEGSGIGVTVNYDSEKKAIRILYVYPDSPAEKALCLAGDMIVAVDGERVSDAGYEATVNKVKGEVGTSVTLTLERDGTETEVTITRDAFTTVSVMSKMLSDNKTAYIRILQFDGTTVEQFAKAYLELEASGAESFVFDVRGNPGGALGSVMGVLSFLLGDDVPIIEISDNSGGIIIQNSSRSAYCTDEYSKTKTTVHDKKTVILTNEDTASAGELFTAVMNTYYTTVGVTTYGKGVMQRTFRLPNGGAVKLTFAKYTAPGVENYDGVGIIPDVEQELSEAAQNKNLLSLTEEEDDQLQAALNVLYGETPEQ